jgi:hypothetical protein
MSGVFRNIDPPTPSPPCECVPPPSFGAGVRHTRWVERGWGVNSSEDARHCSALYICKYFVAQRYRCIPEGSVEGNDEVDSDEPHAQDVTPH